MLLTITTTYRPATDLGYLLSKHPEKCQTFSLAFGKAHVFYPEATEERCAAALLLDFDPVGLVRGRRWGQGSEGTLAHYVNDRPYIASSFLSVAIAQVFSSAMKGVSKGRQALADEPLPFEVSLSAVPSRGGEHLLHDLFEPLGYRVEARRIRLDEAFPEWGEGNCFELRLQAHVRLADLLAHLYVLIPVLDNQKHYWVGDDEVDKLLEKGGEWLREHPMREQITLRYLKHRRGLFRDALERLMADDDPEPVEHEAEKEQEEETLERSISLNDQRLGAVLAVLRDAGAARVLDLGCGEGKLIGALLKEQSIAKVMGVDVSMRSLERARDRLKLDRMPETQRSKVELIQGSLTYRDNRFTDCDAACAIEVIEHVDVSRLGAFERVLFEFTRPPTVIITTPNVEYNDRFESLPAGRLRHRDHRFEWTRQEFQSWCTRVAEHHGYGVRFLPIGVEDAEVGSPTQMAVFQR
jgi:3' terminal RNA ribose 2'-O-methyltransferase Hen1